MYPGIALMARSTIASWDSIDELASCIGATGVAAGVQVPPLRGGLSHIFFGLNPIHLDHWRVAEEKEEYKNDKLHL